MINGVKLLIFLKNFAFSNIKVSAGMGFIGPMGPMRPMGPMVGRGWVTRPIDLLAGSDRNDDGNNDGNGEGNNGYDGNGNDEHPDANHPTSPRAQG